jgi:hypothetical protein
MLACNTEVLLVACHLLNIPADTLSIWTSSPAPLIQYQIEFGYEVSVCSSQPSLRAYDIYSTKLKQKTVAYNMQYTQLVIITAVNLLWRVMKSNFGCPHLDIKPFPCAMQQR